MENYYLAKEKMFKIVGPEQTGIVNIDDSYAQRIIKAAKCKIATFEFIMKLTIKPIM